MTLLVRNSAAVANSHRALQLLAPLDLGPAIDWTLVLGAGACLPLIDFDSSVSRCIFWKLGSHITVRHLRL